jgi:AMP-polyphosphate phosphotransferase
VFDRSWAERVLVEPVMKITSPEDVQRSYAELRAFEWLLEQQGGILVKVWMDITKDEQAQRFEDRAKEKPWKLSDSDTVAREHWDDYTEAANRMFHLTGTDFAPWYIISSEDKRYSRVALLQIANDAVKAAIRK